jgi:D-lactate dehydratase
MSLPRRALIAVTSASAPLHGDNLTGFFISEGMHPYNVFVKAGFEVDFVSEKGTYVPDWLSQQPDFLNGDDKKVWEDVNSEFRTKLDGMLRSDQVDPSKVYFLPSYMKGPLKIFENIYSCIEILFLILPIFVNLC